MTLNRLSIGLIFLSVFLIWVDGGPLSRAFAIGEQDWDAVVKAAQKEGRVALAGPRGDVRRRALTETFEKKFGIEVQYLGTGGPELPPRVKAERRANRYLWDVFIAGTTTLIKGIKPERAFEPVPSALILPGVRNPKNWRGGGIPYVDNDQMIIAVLRQAGQYVFINTQLAKPEEFRSWRDLLNPKWKGKIVIARDPRISGYGRATLEYFYIHNDLGKNYLRQLVSQEPRILRNDRQGALWLAQGKYAICICSDLETTELMDAGLPVKALDPHKIKEGAHVTSAFANIALVNRAPHPNAAKVYFNWVLSKEGSTLFSKATDMPSMRTDVSTEHIKPGKIPDPKWPITNSENALRVEDQVVAFLNQILK